MGFIWGIPYLFIKVAVSDLNPATLVLFRCLIGAVLLLPLAASRGNLRPLLPYWRMIVLYTAVEIALPWLLVSHAETRLSSSLTGLLIAAVPSVGSLIAWLTGGDDRPDLRRVAGLVVGFLGVAALVGLDVSIHDLGAVGELGLVTVCYAVGPMIIARRLSGLPAMGVVAASLAVGAVANMPYGLTHLPATMPPAQVMAAVAVLGVVCTALGFVLFFALISEVGPVRATVITYVNPAVALALGVTLLHEPFTFGAALGFVLIVLGSFLATRRVRTAVPAGAAPKASVEAN